MCGCGVYPPRFIPVQDALLGVLGALSGEVRGVVAVRRVCLHLVVGECVIFLVERLQFPRLRVEATFLAVCGEVEHCRLIPGRLRAAGLLHWLLFDRHSPVRETVVSAAPTLGGPHRSGQGEGGRHVERGRVRCIAQAEQRRLVWGCEESGVDGGVERGAEVADGPGRVASRRSDAVDQ